MAIKLPTGEYMCSVCSKKYPDPFKADNCKASHDTIYFPFTKKELNALLHLVKTQDFSMITEDFIERVEKYCRAAARNGT